MAIRIIADRVAGGGKMRGVSMRDTIRYDRRV